MAYDDMVFGQAANSKIIEIMLRDSTTGQAKASVAYGSVAYSYIREGTNSTVVTGTCVDMTLDAYTDHGWKETSIAGIYQFCVPQAALATGKNACTIKLVASGAIDVCKRILIMGSDLRAVALKADLETIKTQAVTCSAGVTVPTSIGTSTLTQTQVTGGAYDLTNAAVFINANLAKILGTALTETVAGYLSAAFKKLFDVATPLLTVEATIQAAANAALVANNLDHVAGTVTGIPTLPTGTFLEQILAEETVIDGHTTSAQAAVVEALTRLPDATPGETGGLPVVDASGHTAADVHAYTTQPTVTGATLHSDYNAAKTAATQTSVDTVDTVADAVKVVTDKLASMIEVVP
jgi:hypothetical protein